MLILDEHLSLKLPVLERIGGSCLVLGSGHSLWDDMEAGGFQSGKWKQNFGIVAINRVIQDAPCFVDQGYSNHVDMLMNWVRARDVSSAHQDKRCGRTELYGNRPYSNVIDVPLPGHGTSGLNAVYLALMLYDDVKVCGVPLDNGPHYYDPPFFKWNNFVNAKFDEDNFMESCTKDGILRPWVRFLERFHKQVEPLSGRTRKIWEYYKDR